MNRDRTKQIWRTGLALLTFSNPPSPWRVKVPGDLKATTSKLRAKISQQKVSTGCRTHPRICRYSRYVGADLGIVRRAHDCLVSRIDIVPNVADDDILARHGSGAGSCVLREGLALLDVAVDHLLHELDGLVDHARDSPSDVRLAADAVGVSDLVQRRDGEGDGDGEGRKNGGPEHVLSSSADIGGYLDLGIAGVTGHSDRGLPGFNHREGSGHAERSEGGVNEEDRELHLVVESVLKSRNMEYSG